MPCKHRRSSGTRENPVILNLVPTTKSGQIVCVYVPRDDNDKIVGWQTPLKHLFSSEENCNKYFPSALLMPIDWGKNNDLKPYRSFESFQQ